MVQKAITSPNTWGRVSQKIGSVLGKTHWVVGLTTNAFKLSALVNPGDKIDIIKGKVICNKQTIMEIPDLFGTMRVEDMDITEKMCTPEGMASYLRWNVFYDKSKVLNFAFVSTAIAVANTFLDRFLYNFVDPCGEVGLVESDRVFAFKPIFHALEDTADSFVAGSLQQAILENPFLFSAILFPAICLSQEFHQDGMILLPAYKKMTNVTNRIIAVCTGGFFSHQYLFATSRGVVDYLTFYFSDKYLSMNLGDIMIYSLLSAALIKACGSLLSLRHGPLYGFMDKL
jgi:hypothetical protein